MFTGTETGLQFDDLGVEGTEAGASEERLLDAPGGILLGAALGSVFWGLIGFLLFA